VSRQNLYQAIRQGLNSYPKIVPASEEPSTFVEDPNRDWYNSLYFYSLEQKLQIEEKGSVAGIRDTLTDRLFFDLDGDLPAAQKDAFALAGVLFNAGFEAEDIRVYFSGSKGFSVEVLLDRLVNPLQFKKITGFLADNLECFDRVVSDANRIVRIPGTKHQKSGLYKVPLTLEELEFATIDEILALAENPRILQLGQMCPRFPKAWELLLKEPSSKKKASFLGERQIEWSKKPSGWRNCKWALLQGFYEPRKRHEALLRLAATCRGMGFDKETTYYMCKSSLKKQAEIHDQEEFSKDELWNNVVESIFSDTWTGGTYSCKTDQWLKEYCSHLGEHACPSDNHLTVKTKEVFNFFDEYARNYDHNALTTGIGPVDATHARFMVGTSNALLASPGVGKTSLALQLLHHNSEQKIRCIMFSYDMFQAALLTRMIQKHTGLPQNKIYQIWRTENKQKQEIQEMLEEQYKYVDFCFKAGQSPQEIVETIDEVEAKTGEKVKLIVVDYNELVISDKAEETAGSAQVAQKLRQIANEKQVCSITLLQPSKIYSSPADEVTNYNAAKGASSIPQSMTLMLGCSRPGFNPLDSSNDNYFNITCLKNRNGGLFSVDLGWNGLRGDFSALTDDQRQKLANLRAMKVMDKTDNAGGWR